MNNCQISLEETDLSIQSNLLNWEKHFWTFYPQSYLLHFGPRGASPHKNVLMSLVLAPCKSGFASVILARIIIPFSFSKFRVTFEYQVIVDFLMKWFYLKLVRDFIDKLQLWPPFQYFSPYGRTFIWYFDNRQFSLNCLGWVTLVGMWE